MNGAGLHITMYSGIPAALVSGRDCAQLRCQSILALRASVRYEGYGVRTPSYSDANGNVLLVVMQILRT